MRSNAATQPTYENSPAPGVISFSLEVSSQSLTAISSGVEELLGTSANNLTREAGIFLRHCDPTDRFHLLGALDQAFASLAPLDTSYYWIRPDNNQRVHLYCRASAIQDQQHTYLRGIIFSVDYDNSFDRESYDVQNLIDALPDVAFILDSELKIVRIPNWFEAKAKELPSSPIAFSSIKLGTSFWDILASDQLRDEWSETVERLLHKPPARFIERITQQKKTFQLELSSYANALGMTLILKDASELVEREALINTVALQEQRQRILCLAMDQIRDALVAIGSAMPALQQHCADKPGAQLTLQQINHARERAAELSRRVTNNFHKQTSLSAVHDFSAIILDVVHEIADARLVLESMPELPIICNARSTTSSIVSIIKELLEIIPSDAKLVIAANLNHNNSSKAMQNREYAVLRIRSHPLRARRKRSANESSKSESGAQKSHALFSLHVEQVVREMNEHGLNPIIKFEPAPTPALSLYVPLFRDQPLESEFGSAQDSQLDVLLIDNDLVVCSTVASFMNNSGIRTLALADPNQALRYIEAASEIKLVIIDVMLTGLEASSLLRKIKRLKPDLKIVAFNGSSSVHSKKMLDAGACGVIIKPLTAEEFESQVRAYL